MIEAIDWDGMMKVAPVIGVMAIAIMHMARKLQQKERELAKAYDKMHDVAIRLEKVSTLYDAKVTKMYEKISKTNDDHIIIKQVQQEIKDNQKLLLDTIRQTQR